MNTILGKLVEIESAIRSVREELAKIHLERQVVNEEVVDLGNLVDVTPEQWQHWFTDLKYNSPTPTRPYDEFLPNMMLGYHDDGDIRVNIEQTPFVSINATIRYALQIWLVKPVEWFTLELWLPPQTIRGRTEFFISWRSSVSNSQNVDIYIFERNQPDTPLRRKITSRFFPALMSSDIIKVPLNPQSAIIDRKIYFSFPADSFHSVVFEDLRLLICKEV